MAATSMLGRSSQENRFAVAMHSPFPTAEWFPPPGMWGLVLCVDVHLTLISRAFAGKRHLYGTGTGSESPSIVRQGRSCFDRNRFEPRFESVTCFLASFRDESVAQLSLSFESHEGQNR